jgi:hypothetical protein
MKSFKNKNRGLKSRKIVFVLLFFFFSTLIISSRADALIKIVSTFIDMLGNDIYNIGNLNATGEINTTGTVYAGNLNATGDVNGSKIFENGNRFPQTITCSGTDKISALASTGVFTCSAVISPKFVFSGRSSASLTADSYLHPYGAVGAGTSEATEGAQVPFAGTIKNLVGYMSAVQGAGDTCRFVIRKAVGSCTAAFADTTLLCSMVNAVQNCSDTSDTVSVSANDCLQVWFDEAAGTCSGFVSWSFEYDPT